MAQVGKADTSGKEKQRFCGAEAPRNPNKKKEELPPFSRGARSICFHKYVVERFAEVVAQQSAGNARKAAKPNEPWII